MTFSYTLFHLKERSLILFFEYFVFNIIAYLFIIFIYLLGENTSQELIQMCLEKLRLFIEDTDQNCMMFAFSNFNSGCKCIYNLLLCS